MNPSIKRFVKKCEDFYICAEIGEKMAVGVEYADDRLTLYQYICLLYTSPSPRDRSISRMPSSA